MNEMLFFYIDDMNIVANNINKSFSLNKTNSNQILFDINIEVNDNKMIALMGPSGAGKSTLLYILGTLENQDSGEIFYYENETKINKNNLSESELAEFRNINMGFIFQFHHLLPEFTAIENVMMPALIKGGNMKEIKSRASELLKRVGVEHRENHKPSELSGGEQQRVAIARALINNPKILFADEPTGNLDTENTLKVIEILKQIKNEMKITMLIATHSDLIAQNSDEIIKMADGRII